MPVGRMEIEGPVPAPADAHLPVPAVQGSVGTATSLVLRTFQLVAAVMSMVAMLTADDYFQVPAFSFLVVAAGVQAFWSFGMALLDLDIMLIKNKDPSQNNSWFLQAQKFSDTAIGAVTFTAASTASGVLLFVKYDLKSCPMEHCQKFQDAITRGFICFASAVPCIFTNWLTRAGPSDIEAMSYEFTIFTLNMLGIAFACPSLGIGLMLSCHSPNMICNPTMLVEFLVIGGLIVLVFVSSLEVVCQFLAVRSGAITLRGPPFTCLFLVAGKWVTSLWSLGASCATTGVMQIFLANHLFGKPINVYDAVFCALTVAAGVCDVISSCLRAYLVVSRRLRRSVAAQH